MPRSGVTRLPRGACELLNRSFERPSKVHCIGWEELRPVQSAPLPGGPQVRPQGLKALELLFVFKAPFSAFVYKGGEEFLKIPAGWAALRTKGGLLLWPADPVSLHSASYLKRYNTLMPHINTTSTIK